MTVSLHSLLQILTGTIRQMFVSDMQFCTLLLQGFIFTRPVIAQLYNKRSTALLSLNQLLLSYTGVVQVTGRASYLQEGASFAVPSYNVKSKNSRALRVKANNRNSRI